ncbi:MAG: crossover junction endodeoxyribonuclease RuvC [Patescibacteria group bacterium]
MIIIGIDPGTAITGYGIIGFVKNKPLKVVSYGCISTQANTIMSSRLLTLYHEIEKLLDKHKPKEIVIERIFFNTNVKTALSVGQARGVIMLAAETRNIPLFEYTALQAKLILTGYGRAKKKEMQLAVPKYLNLTEKIKQDDAADGLAMAITHLVKIHRYTSYA